MTEPTYERLHDMGIRFQLNLGSLSGFYGQTAQQKAMFILENGWYTYMGSDCHRLRALQEQVTREAVPKGVIKKLSF
jgi:tyrosine-protein phosphatase YwqE